MTRTQPWVHSWYADTFCFFSIPFVFFFMALLKLPPFHMAGTMNLDVIFFVLFIDWAHIFAQYHRIYSNPIEERKLKWVYPLSYLLLIPLMTVLVYAGDVVFIDTLLVYFVIFHFIKQQYGFMKIYSKTDGVKTRREAKTEDLLFYLSMYTPVAYWHVKSFKYDFKWTMLFWKSPIFNYIFWPLLALYASAFALYAFDEFKRTRRNGMFNIPKNMSLLTAIVGWGCLSILADSTMLILFTVVLHHDLSYLFYVWFIGRRDHSYVNKQVKWFSWWSIPGFFVYFILLVVLSDIIMVVHLELTRDNNWDYFFWGHLFNDLNKQEGWLMSFGYALFFATQAHHYFIDRFLWKKEKDLFYQIKTGNYKAG